MAKSWGRWKHIGEQPEEGGQARVYKVIDLEKKYEGDFALKELKNNNRLERFSNEIKGTNLIQHKYLLKIIDSDIKGEKKYYVSKYYIKGTLEKFIQINTDLTFLEKLNLCIEISKGIWILHEDADMIIHRDLKPSNIFITDDKQSIVIGDFGLNFYEGQERQTLDSEAIGSRFYMHPDFADGKIEDIHQYHDLYSFGKIIYFIFSGGKKFDREKHGEEKYNLLKLPFYVYRTELLGFLELINRVLDKLITLDDRARYKIVDHVMTELRNIKKIFENNNHPLVDNNYYHTCDFCGIGKYQSIGSAPDFITQNGDTMNNNPNSRKVLVCNNCGHVQIFTFFASQLKNNWFELGI